jgi:hypothetical protein
VTVGLRARVEDPSPMQALLVIAPAGVAVALGVMAAEGGRATAIAAAVACLLLLSGVASLVPD